MMPGIKRRKKGEIEPILPRPCRLKSCGMVFTPSRSQDRKSQFCCKEHRVRFWLDAQREGANVVSGELVAVKSLPASDNAENQRLRQQLEAAETQNGTLRNALEEITSVRTLSFDMSGALILKSHGELILELLRLHPGEWIDHPYRRLSVMWHSRVAELRHKGHNIEMQRVRDGNKWDYQYRLVVTEVAPVCPVCEGEGIL